MKKLFTFLSVICLSLIVFSCSKNDDPADNDIFVGTYKGEIGYIADGETKGTNDGSVTVVKTGNSYYFRFSDGIPDLTGVSFEKKGDNTLVNIDLEDGIKAIRITASSLTMLYTKDSKTWSATASR